MVKKNELDNPKTCVALLPTVWKVLWCMGEQLGVQNESYTLPQGGHFFPRRAPRHPTWSLNYRLTSWALQQLRPVSTEVEPPKGLWLLSSHQNMCLGLHLGLRPGAKVTLAAMHKVSFKMQPATEQGL